MTASHVAGALILAAMIAISGYGARALHRTARVPVHWAGGYNNYVSKPAGLIIWPAAGALVYVVFLALGSARSARGTGIIMPIIMCILVASQIGAIAAARRRSGA